MRRLSLAAGIVVLGALVFTAGAQACSCVRMEPVEGLRRADAAIVGRLMAVTPLDSYSADYRYRVRHVYKGGSGIQAGGIVSIRSAVDGSACGLPDTEGRRYGLFLNRDGNRWRGGSCGVVAPGELSAAARSRGDGRPPRSDLHPGTDCDS